MFPIQPTAGFRRNEKLTSIRIWSRIGHTHDIGTIVFPALPELVFECAAPDGFAAGAVAEGVAGLYHEFLDDAVEEDVVVVAGAGVGGEVLDGTGGVLREEAELDVAHGGVDDAFRGKGVGAGFFGVFGVFGGGFCWFLIDDIAVFRYAVGWLVKKKQRRI